MANKYSSLGALFTAIANAIRSKNGDTAGIVADDFPEVITNLRASDLIVKELVATDPTDPAYLQSTGATIVAGGSADVLVYHNANISKGDILLVGYKPYGSVIARVTSKSANSGQTYDDYSYMSNVVMYNLTTGSINVTAAHSLYKITD